MSNITQNRHYEETHINDVIGVIKPETYKHKNIDDLSMFDFKVDRRPLFIEAEGGLMKKLDRKFAVVRSDTDEVLGVHGKTYKIVPHIDMYLKHAEAVKKSSAYTPNIEIIDQLWDNGGKARRTIHFLDHQKSIKDGQDLVNMRSDTFNSLDGSFSFQVFSGMFRSLCLNTLVFGGEKFYHSKQKHTTNINISSAVAKIANSLTMYINNVDKLMLWKNKKVTDEAVALLFANTITKKKSESFTNIKTALQKEGAEINQLINIKLNDYLMHRFQQEKESLGNTLYAVYNAITHWSTHTNETFERQNKKGEFVEASTSRANSNVANVQIAREQKVREVLDSEQWKELELVA